MGRFQSLILMSVALITLVSCSSTEDKIHLGSRDDIIVTNRGMPKPTSTPEALAPMMKQEAIEQKAQETAEKVKTTTKPTEEVIEKAAQGIENQPLAAEEEKEDITEIIMEEPVEEAVQQVQEVVEEVSETMTEAVESKTVAQTVPMGTTTMKSEAPLESDTVEKSAPVEEVKEEKVEGGCYKKVVVTIDGKSELGERRIVCDKDLTPSVIAIVQQALKSNGYDLGRADGKAGINTYAALEVYQRENGLGMGGFTYETLEHLSIRIK